MTTKRKRVAVLFKPEDFQRLKTYCAKNGHTMSRLIALILNNYLDEREDAAPPVKACAELQSDRGENHAAE